jgi:ABC-type branched-subunit amino acid transport system substrate-binding protein
MLINLEILPRVLPLNKPVFIILVLFLVLLTTQTLVAANESLDRAVAAFQAKQYAEAEAILKNILLSDKTEEQDGAMYLMVRILLARNESKEAIQASDRLIKRFPSSSFVQYARFAKAEGCFLTKDFSACADELVWVNRNSTDERLRQKAEGMLANLKEQAASSPEKSNLDLKIPDLSRVAPAQLSEGRVALIIAYSGAENDPTAKQMQRSFRYGADYGKKPFPVTIFIVGSAFEAARTAKSLMKQDSLLMVFFAGDEGAALSVALVAKDSKVPVLKLTSDVRSLASFSNEVFEFLPSMETQAVQLGKFAADVQHNKSGMVLSSNDEKGLALAEGFRRGMVSESGVIESEEFYAPESESIRPELEKVFSNLERISKGKTPLKSALTPEERASLFGNAQGGEVLVGDPVTDSLEVDSVKNEDAFFLALSPERISAYASQMRSLPKKTTLYGNSSWIDPESLAKQSKVTAGMYIAAPLLPEMQESDDVLRLYETAISGKATAWELLGLDAAEFVGTVLETKPINRDAMRRGVVRTCPYFGRVVTVNFLNTQENQSARILRFEDNELKVVR